jgi:tripartite-type tricarboxylate transporter receptor subunit TctC
MKRVSNLAMGFLALLLIENSVAQTKYPEKPIRMIVSSAPGSPTDIIARVLGQKFAETMGQSLLIDNAPGAAGNIGADRVAKAAPDGYTLGTIGFGPLVVNPSLYKLPYDPVKDFAAVTQLNTIPNMLLVNNGVPAKSVTQLIALAKAQPGALTYASGGAGTSTHLAPELFKSAASLDIRHIPYNGTVLAMADLLGGRITMVFFPMSVAVPLAREGKLRALAVTSLHRSSAAPDVPTIAESGYPGFEVIGWNGMVAPAGTAVAIVRKLHMETAKAFALPNVRAKFVELGVEGVANSPAEFAAIIKSEIPKWAKVIKDAGIKLD